MVLIDRIIKKLILRYSTYIYQLMNQIDLDNHTQTIENLKKKMKSCGKGVGIWGKVHITSPESIILGNNVHIGENAVISARGGLIIGDNTHISRNLVLYTINHDFKGTKLPYDENTISRPVSIGKNVWIGMNVCITPGTIINDGAIIGMGTIVSGEVPPLAIIGNAKWRILGYRDRNHYEELEMKRSFGGPNGYDISY